MSAAIHPGAQVDLCARLGEGVTVGPGCVIGPEVEIGPGTRLDANVLVTGRTRIGARCRLHQGAVVGSEPQDLKYQGEPTACEVGDDTVIREYATVNRATQMDAATRLGRHCLLMAYSHVAHDCVVGDHVILANAVNLAGFVTIEEWAIVGGMSPVHQFVRIGAHSIIGGGYRVPQDVAPYVKAGGYPLTNAGLNHVGLLRRGFSEEVVVALKQAYRLLFREKLTVSEAVKRIREGLPPFPEVEHFARFAETSVRGLTR